MIVYRFLLTVPSGAPFVSLEASPQTATGGDNINVTCTVLGEPEVDVSFTWTFPSQVGGQLDLKPKVRPGSGQNQQSATCAAYMVL